MNLPALSRRGRFVVATAAAVLLGLTVSLLGVPAQAVTMTGTGGVFVPLTGRILDTTTGVGGFTTPMPAEEWRTIQVAGEVGLPDDGTVGAVSFTATVSDLTTEGQLLGRPDADTASSMLGKYGGYENRTTTFAGVLAVSADGTIEVQTQTQVRLILDVQGYYTTSEDGTAPGGFVPLNGKRIVDTRSGLGAPAVALASGQSIDVQVTGLANGIPSGASAVIVNLIAVNTSTARGWMTPYPTGTVRPGNTFHYPPNIVTSMQAQVELSDSGKFTLYNSSTTTHVVIDLQGYFTATSEDEATFTPAAGRIYDSRDTPDGSFEPNEIRSIPVAGFNGIPPVADGITAVALTITSLGTVSGSGRAMVWADGSPAPGTNAISLWDHALRSNTITVPVGPNGAISLQHFGDNANYILDVQGWYSNPPAPDMAITCPQPYAADSWVEAVNLQPVTCTFTADNPYSTALEVDLFHNAEIVASPLVLDPGASATQSFSLVPYKGEHLLMAGVRTSTGIPFTSKYRFKVGTWMDSEWAPSIEDGGLATDTPTLMASAPESDEFPEDGLTVYTLTLNPDGQTDPIFITDGTQRSVQVPQGTIQIGRKYYWRVTATGRPGDSSSPTTFVGPVWSFTAGADVPFAGDGTDNTNAVHEELEPTQTQLGINGLVKSNCAPVAIIAVRGTDAQGGTVTSMRNKRVWEGGGYGTMLGKLVERYATSGSYVVNAAGLIYPASGGPGYHDSVATGVTNLVNEVNWLSKNCTVVKPKVILLGHSQGADVILDALSSGRFSQTSLSRIRAVAVFGDPTYRPNRPYNYGDRAADGMFGRSMTDLARLQNFRTGSGTLKLKSWCYNGDFFCDSNFTGEGMRIHGAYLTMPARVTYAYSWINGLL